MTMQACDIIIYKGETLTLMRGNPFYHYLKTRKDLVFEWQSTDAYRGYIAVYKLENNKLSIGAHVLPAQR